MLRGQVALIRPDGSVVQPAPSGITVRPGDEIRTLDAAGALITFFSGIEIELGEDTILVVENVTRDGDRVDVSLKQVLGTAVNRVQTLADPGSTITGELAERHDAGRRPSRLRATTSLCFWPTTAERARTTAPGGGRL